MAAVVLHEPGSDCEFPLAFAPGLDGLLTSEPATEAACPVCGHPESDHRSVERFGRPALILCFAPVAGNEHCYNRCGACRKEAP